MVPGETLGTILKHILLNLDRYAERCEDNVCFNMVERVINSMPYREVMNPRTRGILIGKDSVV